MASILPDESDRAPTPATLSDRITTIGADQGAKLTTRENASEAADLARENAERRYRERHPDAADPTSPENKRRRAIVLAIVIVLALVVLFFAVRLLTRLLTPSAADIEAATLAAAAQEQAEDVIIQEQEPVDGSVSYGDYSFYLETAESGLLALMRADGAGNATALIEIEGTPFAVLRYQNVILVPESCGDGTWDVVCYVEAGTGVSNATHISNLDGTRIGGTGTITDVTLEGSDLVVTDNTGATTRIEIE